MKSNSLIKTTAIFLAVILIAPPIFFVMPQHAQAFLGIGDITFDPTNFVKNTITALASKTTSLASLAEKINTYVLQPAAYLESGNLLKAMTAGIVDFVNKGNAGSPMYVQNLMGNTQMVGDSQAIAFFAQFGNLHSPFASSINRSLRNNYLQNTSLSGFWNANQCTLYKSSSNQYAFLAGDWSKGGAGAWFALTTQDQNNPYTLYQKSQAQLNSLVANAVSSRLSELDWGQGFLSWCGKGTAATETAGNVVDAGDPCINADGTSGVIKTPGSVIAASLNKALGSNQDKLAQTGSVANDVNKIFHNAVTIAQTVQFAQQVLGGLNSGGLFGVSETSPATGGRRIIDSFSDSEDFMGTNSSTVGQDSFTATSSIPDLIADMTTRIVKYQTAWDTINSAAIKTKNKIIELQNYCNQQISLVENSQKYDLTVNEDGDSEDAFVVRWLNNQAKQIAISTDQTLNSTLTQIFEQIEEASTTIATANDMVLKIQNELDEANATSTPDITRLTIDVQTLQTMSPTQDEVVRARQDSYPYSAAGAALEGSAAISGSSLMDTLNSLYNNAHKLINSNISVSDGSGSSYKSSCNLDYQLAKIFYKR